MEDQLTNTKIVIIGEPSVGKTSLRRSFIGEKFRKNYIETIGSDFSYIERELENGIEIGYSIWDLAGQEKFKNVHPLFVKGSYGCIVVYSVTDRSSFETIDDWINTFIETSNREKLPIMIIGNKIDLLEESPDDFISVEEQNKLVDHLQTKYPERDILSFRTSALTKENVDQGFKEFGNAIYKWFLNQSSNEQQFKIQNDIDKNIPGAYALVMNQIIGPQMIATVPKIPYNSEEMIKIVNSGIKLIASIDFDDVISQSSITSSIPWAHPRGIFHYIAFVLDNSKARGKNELFIIGINADRELDDPLSGLKGVVNGFLHNALNELARLIINNNKDLVTKQFNPDDHEDFIEDVQYILKNLREKVHQSIKKWYNIPD